MTWGDLFKELSKLTPEQLDKPIQVIQTQPNTDDVHPALPAYSFSTVGELGWSVRSTYDNRHHADDLILCVDYNPFGEDGSFAYNLVISDTDPDDWSLTPIYPPDHTIDADWSKR